MCDSHCHFVVPLHILSMECLDTSLQNSLGKHKEICILFLSLRSPQLESPCLPFTTVCWADDCRQRASLATVKN